MNLINDVRRRWSSGIAGKLMIGVVVVAACCMLALVGAALRQGRPATVRPTPTPGGKVFVAPTFPSPPTATPEPQPTVVPPTQAPTAEPAVAMTPQQAAELVARNVCGERFRSASFDGGVLIVCALEDSWTAMMVVAGALDNFKKIATGATAADPSLEYVTVQLVATFKDRLGNEAEQPAYTFRMRSSLIQRVQWANMTTKDVSYLLAVGTSSVLRESLQIAEDESGAGVHPALRETWDTYLKTN
jgi:hypothetical protein